MGMLSCAATCSCGESRHFLVRGHDGASAMYGLERELRHNRSGSWIFCEGEADTRATEMRFTVGSYELRVPQQITQRIANPGKVRFVAERLSASGMMLRLIGPNRIGTHRLDLEFKDGQLLRAWMHTVGADAPEVLFP